MANLFGVTPTAFVDAVNQSQRSGEVPAWNVNTGCDNGSNACGIGINLGGGEITGDPAQFTLIDQKEEVRVPQCSDYIGNTGYVDRSVVDWPSSGGTELQTDIPILGLTPSDSGDGSASPAGTANLQTLAAGWVDTVV